jgi:hypothetical protein
MLALLLMLQAAPAKNAGANSPIAVPIQGVTSGKPVTVDASGSAITVTGVSTAANQTNGQQQVQGNVASGATDAGNPVKVGGVYNSTLINLTAAQRGDLQLDPNGNLRARIFGYQQIGGDGLSNGNLTTVTLSTSASTNTTPGLLVASTLFNGTAWDRNRSIQANDMSSGLGVSAVATAPTSAASQAVPYTTVFGAATSVLKASAGNLYGINANNSTTASFVIAYNGTSAPTSGTALTAAQVGYCFALPASQSSDKVFNPPVRFGTGVTLLISTSCTTYTAPGVLPLTLTGYFQ